VAFTRWPGAHEDWPEFGRLLGARGANHRDSRERVVIRLDDPAHPLTRVFGGEGFEFSDEFFRVQDPYSRERVRVLLSIDTQRTDLTQGVARGQVERADQDYALAWVRRYGRGRVAYCTIAHNPYVFWDTRMLEFYLATLQFVLGDLPAPTTPSARLTPAVRARETLSWTLGLASARGTVLEAIDEAAKLRLTSVSLSAGQPFNGTNMTGFGPGLGAAERELLRFKLDEAGLRVDACELAAWPADATAARSWFAFARTFGLQLVAAPVTLNELPAADALCREFDLNLAIPAAALQPARLSRVLESCSSHVGVAVDPGAWGGADIDVAEAVRALGGRILLVQMGQSPIKNVAPQARLGPILDALHRQGVHPLLINLRQAALPADPAFPRLVEAIDGLCLRLAPEH
jgi:hypothetical protein